MLLAATSGFIAGIALGSFVYITFGFIIFLLFLTGVTFGYKYFVEESHHQVLFIIICVFLGMIFGVGRVYVSDLYTHSQLDTFVGEKVSALGIVVDEPDVREANTKLTVRLSSVFDGVATTSVREKVLVSVPLYPEYHYGDKVGLQLTLTEPQDIETDGRVFDYKGYLRVRGIWYTSRFVTIHLDSSGHGSIIKNLLFKTKHAFVNSINNALPEPESSLLAGLLLGSKQSLGKDLLAEFQRSGVSHVVVLSGYNIAIVAESIMNLLKFLPKTAAFGFGTVSIVLFTILSGGGASAWRAAIMVLVALFAKRMNRDYKVGRVLGFTVVLMLAPNPLLLAFDPSFQLSILATIGLVFVSPRVSPYLTKVTEGFGLRLKNPQGIFARTLRGKVLGEIVSSTIATQIVVLPFLIYNTGLFSLVSLPVNVLILGTVPLTMLLGFITGIIGLFSLYLSFVPAFFTYILLWYELTIVHLGAALPFGAVKLPAFSPTILIMVYVIIFTTLYWMSKRS